MQSPQISLALQLAAVAGSRLCDCFPWLQPPCAFLLKPGAAKSEALQPIVEISVHDQWAYQTCMLGLEYCCSLGRAPGCMYLSVCKGQLLVGSSLSAMWEMWLG
jgi:hypothetical protein